MFVNKRHAQDYIGFPRNYNKGVKKEKVIIVINSIVWIILNNNIAVQLRIVITQLMSMITKTEAFQEDLFLGLNKCLIKNSLF